MVLLVTYSHKLFLLKKWLHFDHGKSVKQNNSENCVYIFSSLSLLNTQIVATPKPKIQKRDKFSNQQEIVFLYIPVYIFHILENHTFRSGMCNHVTGGCWNCIVVVVAMMVLPVILKHSLYIHTSS